MALTRDDSSAGAGRVRVGVGGWVYEPWRGTFFPPGLPKTRELEHASRRLTAIEINATYYRAQSPASFAKWRDATPDDFVFSVKATRYATQRRVLAEAGESIERFFASGVAELGDKLGPVLWQLAPTKGFDADDIAAFLDLLPERLGERRLRHAIETRHPSFRDRRYVELLRRRGVAAVFVDSADIVSVAEQTADFIYARLMRCEPQVETGYPPADVERWAGRAIELSRGDLPTDLPRVVDDDAGRADGDGQPRDVFLFFISGAKERAPFAASATIEALGRPVEPPSA